MPIPPSPTCREPPRKSPVTSRWESLLSSSSSRPTFCTLVAFDYANPITFYLNWKHPDLRVCIASIILRLAGPPVSLGHGFSSGKSSKITSYYISKRRLIRSRSKFLSPWLTMRKGGIFALQLAAVAGRRRCFPDESLFYLIFHPQLLPRSSSPSLFRGGFQLCP